MHLRGFYILIVFFAFISCAPVARFSVDGSGEKAPARIEFKNDSKRADSYVWDFGDGNKSEVDEPGHTYYLSGNYEVTLEAKKGEKVSKSKKSILVEAPKSCQVLLETEYGNMVIELSDLTPLHRDNFTKLADEQFYDGLLFHRVIQGFMIQGGDPMSRDASPTDRLGSGGPGYQVDAEFKDELIHLKGAIAAARIGGPANPEMKSSGSQFYIVQGGQVDDTMLDRVEANTGKVYTEDQREAYKLHGGTPFLDTQYTVFGKVLSGMEVIDKIAAARTNPGDRPVEDIKMKISVIH